MKPADPDPAAAPADAERVSAASNARRGSPATMSSILQWFTRSRDMSEARRAAQRIPEQARHSLRRAHLAAEVAQRTLKPVEPFHHGPPHELACELYRQSAYWMLRSLVERDPDQGSGSSHAWDAHDAEVASLDAVWEIAEQRGLLDRSPELDVVEELLSNTSPASFASLTPKQSRERALTLQEATQVLRDRVDPAVRIRRHWRERLRRGWLLVAAGGALWLGALVTVDWWEVHNDLSRDKPWVASSLTPLGCTSPAKKCDNSPDFFFHTRYEPEPWFVTDLGSVQTFSRVHVVNRRDCCPQRAIPLIVEVRSSKQEPWTLVARQDDAFEKLWRAEFASVRARYVRLRVGRYSYLHLAAVYVLP